MQRLTALEAAINTALPNPDRITMAEWRQWHETGMQPQRWRGNATIQEWVMQALERRQQVDTMMAEYEEPTDDELMALTGGSEVAW